MPARNLLVVNQFYAPDYAATGQVAAELCAGLAAKGLRIRVVAGEPSYTEAAPAAPAYESSTAWRCTGWAWAARGDGSG